MINFTKLQKSLENLRLQYDNYLRSGGRESLMQIDKEAIQESVIQRFEICYDILWKYLEKFLKESMGLVDIPNSPKPVFRLAFENKVIDNIEDWLSYANARVDTSHDYSEEKAAFALELIEDFIKDAISLYDTISKSK